VIRMEQGDIAKYRNTGTVGRIERTEDRSGAVWALLDSSRLWYDAAYLDPATEDELRDAVERRTRPPEKSAQDLEREKEEMAEVAAKFSEISPAGAG